MERENMGRQQSFIKFKNKEVLVSEVKKYQERDSSGDQTYLLCANEVIKDIVPFKKGELLLVVGGERHGQRNTHNLKNETGLGNVERIVFIDNERYSEMSDGDLGGLLDEHFRALTKDEHDELIK